MKTLVLGLGNPILTDDGIGIHVVRQVAAQCARSDVTCVEASVGGLRLLETIAGYDRLILVDAAGIHDAAAGQVSRLRVEDVQASLHAGSTHDLSFGGALAFGRSLGLKLPADHDITVIAIAVEDVLTFGEALTPAVAAALPHAAEAVLSELTRIAA